MKFGAQASQGNIGWAKLLDLWQEVDTNTGLDSLWLMDHFVTGSGQEFGSDGPCLEAWTGLAAMAQATSRVRLGILVTGNTYRHPAVLAKQATTVDHISGGRLIFGIGAGWHEYEHQAYGIPMPNVKERLDRLEEAVHLIKALWTEERPSFAGKFYSLDRPPYNPPNVQTPHPPIMIGGGGEKRTLRIVAQYADLANVSGTPDEVRHKFSVLDQHCADLGRDPKEIRRTVMLPLFMNDDPAFRERVIQGVMAMRGGTSEDAVQAVLIGGPDEMKDRIAAFQDAGAEEVCLAFFPAPHRKGLLRFAEDVLPGFT